jgi:DNA-binding NtrC family response regulator
MSRSVLLIDDDTALLGVMEKAFRRAGYSVMAASSGEVGVDTYVHDATDLVFLDLNLPDIPGMEVLAQLRAVNPDVVAIVLTGQADVETAVAAMSAGAENFLAKPINIHHLYAAADRAYEKIELRRRTSYLEARTRAAEPEPLGPEETGAVSAEMTELGEKISLVAPTDTTILILGETGTGKSWSARRIHALSRRAGGPFVELNAATLSPTFLESELFGHEKGAFTDARTMKRGLFEVADGGTLFLDEIGELAPQLQPKLLHVIESQRFRRIGGTRDIESDVRLIAATNLNLKEAVATGRFREDLYYRLAVLPLTLPPLRKRDPAEIRALATELLHHLDGHTGALRKTLSPEAMRHLVRYPWPGNIRELRNVIERALIIAQESRVIEPRHLPSEVRGESSPRPPSGEEGVDFTLEEVQRRYILRVLAHCGGNRSRAARVLGISRVGLYKKLDRMEVDPGG